jgi:ferritin-like metal-binding protein YciE
MPASGTIASEAVPDAGMIAVAQAVEHYESARYGTLIAWLGQSANEDVSKLLEVALVEEKHRAWLVPFRPNHWQKDFTCYTAAVRLLPGSNDSAGALQRLR